jgi:hypothetical protein
MCPTRKWPKKGVPVLRIHAIGFYQEFRFLEKQGEKPEVIEWEGKPAFMWDGRLLVKDNSVKEGR